MANKKRMAVTLGAMALTAVVAIGGTLAYLSYVTDKKTNSFSSSQNVKAETIEEKWEKEGKNEAKKYQPGSVIAKDPVVKAMVNSEDFYAGMRLNFLDAQKAHMPYGIEKNTSGQATGFCAYATHDTIGENWTLIARNLQGDELYGYKTVINTKNPQTVPIFNRVIVNAGITTVTSSTEKTIYTKITTTEGGVVTGVTLNEVTGGMTEGTNYFDENGNAVGYNTLPTFEIEAQGYAVQSDNTTMETATANIISLANSHAKAAVGSSEFFTAIE
ncbi:MAG: hypothetical protein RR275_00115 [Lachnospiraceae bacterium]